MSVLYKLMRVKFDLCQFCEKKEGDDWILCSAWSRIIYKEYQLNVDYMNKKCLPTRFREKKDLFWIHYLIGTGSPYTF